MAASCSLNKVRQDLVNKNLTDEHLSAPIENYSPIVDYITKNHFDYEMAKYVKPRNKFKADLLPISTDTLVDSSESFKDLDSIIGDIENSHIKIPVLLRQYMNLNAKIISFNIDPKFSDCLDGFLVVDTHNIPPEMLEKLGKNL